VDYVYDLVGKIKQVTDPTGTYGFAYDNMGRLIGTTTQYTFVAGMYSNSYGYDAASNRASLTVPDGSITTYGYDTLNRLNLVMKAVNFNSMASVSSTTVSARGFTPRVHPRAVCQLCAEFSAHNG
jgi:YD repeat-containing protein